MPFRSSAPHIIFECRMFAPRSVFLVFSAAYYFRVRTTGPSKCPLGLQRRVLLSRAGYLPLEVFSRSSAPHITFECRPFAPQSVFSVFSAAYCFWLQATGPSKCPFGLQRRVMLSSAGCLPIEVFSRSSAPHITFECGLFAPQSVFSVFSTAYCFRVRATGLSKCPFGLQRCVFLSSTGCLPLEVFSRSSVLHLLSSAGSLPLEVFSRSSAPHIAFECGLLVPRNALSVFSAACCFWVRAACPSKCFLGL
jgi:hypothetical protein